MTDLDRIYTGHALALLKSWPDAFVHCAVTSPPYWGLRDYKAPPEVWGGDEGHEHAWGESIRVPRGGACGDSEAFFGRDQIARDAVKNSSAGAFCECGAWRGQLGLEPTPALFVEHLVAVLREVRRVLRSDGTLWLNIGDSYATGAGAVGACPGGGMQGGKWRERGAMTQPNRLPIEGIKEKELVGVPWMLAFALRADGWYLRQDIIWSKPNPRPESVMDRCTKAHEYIFLLSKSPRYYYDQEAIAEPVTLSTVERMNQDIDAQASSLRVPGKTNGAMKAVLKRSGNKVRRDRPDAPEGTGKHQAGSVPWEGSTRNKRSVWTVTTKPFKGDHFATFPPDLIAPCILAGSPRGGVVLDPFMGAGTTALVAAKYDRRFLGCEINPRYIEIAEARVASEVSQEKML